MRLAAIAPSGSGGYSMHSMLIDPFWLLLLVKMIATAGAVMAAAWVAERLGPVFGAMVATLPISAGPAYVFLALDQSPAFLANSAASSLTINMLTGLICVIFAAAATRLPGYAAVAAALAVWIGGAGALLQLRLEPGTAFALALGVLVLSAVAARPFATLQRIPAVVPRWWDLPLRAVLASIVVGLVIAAGTFLGPKASGAMAVFPVILVSLMILLHLRLGGEAAAAVLANCTVGLIGLEIAFGALHVSVEPLGSAAGIAVFLLTAIVFNGSYALLRHRR